MQNSSSDERDEIGGEYDISESRPNPYAADYAEGVNLVRLDPDVAKVFPDSESVNRALRALIQIIEESSHAA
ncbi:MAG: hypothetical protein ACODAE_04605 [Gemmatimonadota bacterium]